MINMRLFWRPSQDGGTTEGETRLHESIMYYSIDHATVARDKKALLGQSSLFCSLMTQIQGYKPCHSVDLIFIHRRPMSKQALFSTTPTSTAFIWFYLAKLIINDQNAIKHFWLKI